MCSSHWFWWQCCFLCSITALGQSIRTAALTGVMIGKTYNLFWRFCVLNIIYLFLLPPVFSAKNEDKMVWLLQHSMRKHGHIIVTLAFPLLQVTPPTPPGIDQGVLSLTAALPVPLSSLSAVAIQAARSSLFFWLQVEVNASNKEPPKVRYNQIKPV